MRDKPVQLGIDLRDEALDATECANAPWVSTAYATVETLARNRAEFTTDAVWALVGGAEPSEPRAMGAVMRRAMRAGLAVATDRTVNSVRPDCHRRPVRVWRSLIYSGVR